MDACRDPGRSPDRRHLTVGHRKRADQRDYGSRHAARSDPGTERNDRSDPDPGISRTGDSGLWDSGSFDRLDVSVDGIFYRIAADQREPACGPSAGTEDGVARAAANHR
jgi:hypothetical protein